MTLFREPFNAWSHGAMVLVGAGALVPLVAWSSGVAQLAGALVYGSMFILLFSASFAYHAVHVAPETLEVFRKFDHTSIYGLIAGTYTPALLVPGVDPFNGWALAAIWIVAGVGMALPWLHRTPPKAVRIVIYIVLGWGAVTLLVPLVRVLGWTSLVPLGLGGILYTIGAIQYGRGRPVRWGRGWGSHEAWHLWVIGASLAHMWFVLGYAVAP